MKFTDIRQVTPPASYRVNVPWTFLKDQFEAFARRKGGLDLDPDFQRGHVWSELQETRYVEFVLSGGGRGTRERELLFNKPGFSSFGSNEPMVLVDGKQRLKAVMGFLDNEVQAFGLYRFQFEDDISELFLNGPDFIFAINSLPKRTDVLQWYLDTNSGGTVHDRDELRRVQAMLDYELSFSDIQEKLKNHNKAIDKYLGI